MLLDFVQTDLCAQEVGELLTMAGFELEGIEEVEGEFVLDIKVMSNRGDGLSVFGLAREVLAKDGQAHPTELYTRAASRFADAPLGVMPNPAKVRIETSDCTRYACRYFEGITNGQSPEWIQQRLFQAGQRPISLLVDLTNYVMLELGQPLHAFDFDKLGAEVVVRNAKAGEKLTTLNGVEHELSPDQMMICDGRRPVAAAGVMGGLDTEVEPSSTRILLESAHFLNTSVRRTRKQLGLSTDASYRYERSVDPDGVVAAIERLTELLGLEGSEIVDVYPGGIERQPVSLRVERASRLLGMTIKEEQAQTYLRRLGMEVAGHGDPFYVIPPSWRPDIVREIDLIEELGRVHGFDLIPELHPEGFTTLGGSKGEYLLDDFVREEAVRLGFVQCISHSLRDVHLLDQATSRVQPRNPASPEMAYLRNSLWPSLSDAASRNGTRDLHLFEIGKVFSGEPGKYCEHLEIAFLSTGRLVEPSRANEVIPVADFYSLKGVLQEVALRVGVKLRFAVDDDDPRLHPTRQARIFNAAGESVGRVGQIHPEIAEKLGLPEATFIGELLLDALVLEDDLGLHLKTISRNPAVRRDIALLIDKAIPFESLERAIETAAGDLLERQWLFDVYDGKGIPEGKHSLGFGLQFRKLGSNFTDEEANQVRDRVVEALTKLGGSTR